MLGTFIISKHSGSGHRVILPALSMENLSHSLRAAALSGERAELEEMSQLIIMF